VASDHARTVIGLDLSDAVLRAHRETRDRPNVHVVQGDILTAPTGARYGRLADRQRDVSRHVSAEVLIAHPSNSAAGLSEGERIAAGEEGVHGEVDRRVDGNRHHE